MVERDIIVNADDFGKDALTTEAILRCLCEGNITHTTCMVNMPYCTEAMRLAKENGVLDRIGLHVNLTEGVPLTDDIRKCSLFCDSDGQFNGAMYRHGLKTRFLLPLDVRKAVKTEVDAQAEKFIELGGVLMHADSHHHVHFDWAVGRVVVPELKVMGFSTVRIGYNAGNGRRLPVRIYRAIYNKWIRCQIGARSDWFCSYPGYQDETENWKNRSGTVEIMVHPIIVDGVIKDGENGAIMSLVGDLIK